MKSFLNYCSQALRLRHSQRGLTISTPLNHSCPSISPHEAKNVLVALGEDARKPDGAELLDAVGAERIYVRTSEEYLSAREHAEVMFVCDLNTPSVREHGPGRLAWIHTNSIGVNAVATPEVAAAGTQVSNTREVFERPMAEFVLSSILAQSQLLRQAHQFQAEKRWQQRTVGLI